MESPPTQTRAKNGPRPSIHNNISKIQGKILPTFKGQKYKTKDYKQKP
jgi:hypothetical protein